MTYGVDNRLPLPAGENGGQRRVSATESLDPKEVAAKVQGMFLEVMLKAMEESVEAEDGLFGKSLSSDIYRGMLREHFSRAMSEKMESPLEKTIDRALTQPKPETLPVSGVISSPEGWRRDPINGEARYHAGTDIAALSGTPIRAVDAGRVIESGLKSGYGNTVVIETEDGRKMLYAHKQ
jgi:murein DD-endopeptidase MepM/ murein hydrolase activator NlpD